MTLLNYLLAHDFQVIRGVIHHHFRLFLLESPVFQENLALHQYLWLSCFNHPSLYVFLVISSHTSVDFICSLTYLGDQVHQVNLSVQEVQEVL